MDAEASVTLPGAKGRGILFEKLSDPNYFDLRNRQSVLHSLRRPAAGRTVAIQPAGAKDVRRSGYRSIDFGAIDSTCS
jgi:hypothetical protein